MTRSISFVNKEGKGRRNEGGVEEEIIGVGESGLGAKKWLNAHCLVFI